ncbi:MAG: preprotein translocase subunit Sec61beta [Promethearchaeota archaeon]
MAKTKKTGARKKRRQSNAPMPSGGAGLIRFFEDSSQGFKIGPIWTVGLAVTLILGVILARVGVFSWLLGG